MENDEILYALARLAVCRTQEQRQEAVSRLESLLDRGAAPRAREQETLQIRQVLMELGIPENLKGYGYLLDAIGITLADGGQLLRSHSREEGMWGALARKYGTTPARVDRSIRHAIERGWEQGSFRAWQLRFPEGDKKPGSGLFISRIACLIRLDNAGRRPRC